MYGLVSNLLILFVLVVVIVGLLFFARLIWRSRKDWIGWLGATLAVVLALVIGLITVIAVIGFFKFYAPRPNAVHQVKVEITPERVARGQQLAYFCAGCHSTTGKPPLDGSATNLGDQPGSPPLGDLYPPNLTPGGPLATWTDGEIIRAIREGVHQDGRSLLIMPADSFHNASDEDVESLVAYLRSQPASSYNPPEMQPNLAALLVLGAGLYPPSAQTPIDAPIIAPPRGATAAYGKYLVSISDCHNCHGEDLAGGGQKAFTPIGPNLTVIVPKMTQDQFIQTIRTGVDPTGHKLDPALMPWKELSATYSDDEELAAIYQYVHGLAPIIKPAK